MIRGTLIVLLTPTLKQYRVRKFVKTIGSEYFEILQLKLTIADIFKGCILT